jgi:hypothetical protein
MKEPATLGVIRRNVKKVFLTWQDPESRRWLPVGQLSRDRDEFRFVYIPKVPRRLSASSRSAA